jgi:hypothetical protein
VKRRREKWENLKRKKHEKKKWKDMKKGTKGKRRIARAVEDHSRNMDRKRIYE